MKGDEGTVSKLVTRLVGSPDIYSHSEREPEQSINFVTCHDGFTLNDLVSYNNKHNEANNEENRDGSNDNLSWNCGIEGPTDDTIVEQLRNRQVKNFLTLTLLSIGAPMILMGDEVRRTQYGNNNAYCQNNELSWFNWSLVQKHADIHRFVKHLVHVRMQRDASQVEYSMSLNQLLGKALITWHGIKLNQPDWSQTSHSIAFTVQSLSSALLMHFMLNAYHDALEFELPQLKEFINWDRWIDTALESPDDICYWENAITITDEKYLVQPYTSVILVAKL